MNTLKIEAKLAEKYGYAKLEENLSLKYRQFFFDNIPPSLSVDGGGTLLTCNGSKICNSYRRIVIGDYGAFVEFEHIPDDTQFVIAPGQEYRINDPKYSKNVKYIWMTIPDESNVKIYH